MEPSTSSPPTAASSMTRRDVLRGVGVGVVALGPVGPSPVAAQETPGTGTEEQTGTTHTVEMTDDLVFDPDELTIAPGDTVNWVNVGSVGHSVTAYEDEVPEGAYFASGDFDTEAAARSGYPTRGDVPGGETYSHTFDVEGTYGYFCIPHESVGMVGEFEVVEGGAAPEPAVELPFVPDSAKSLAVATTTAMISVVALVYIFLKYGGDYEGQEEVEPRPRGR